MQAHDHSTTDPMDLTTCDDCGTDVCPTCRVNGPTIYLPDGSDDGLLNVQCHPCSGA